VKCWTAPETWLNLPTKNQRPVNPTGRFSFYASEYALHGKALGEQ